MPTYSGTFFSFASNIPMEILHEIEPCLFSMVVFLTPETIGHTREVYNLLDLFGELGGVIEIFIISFGVVLYPISKHSFILNATKILFKAKTTEKNLFKISKKDKLL